MTSLDTTGHHGDGTLREESFVSHPGRFVGAGTALVAVLLTQQACGDAGRPTAASPKDPGGLLRPIKGQATLAVGADGWIELSDDFGDRAHFVLDQIEGDRFHIRTARLPSPVCVEVGQAEAVITAPCDAAKTTQLFRFAQTGTAADGKPFFSIRTVDDAYVTQSPASGVRAIHQGAGVPDKGKFFFLPSTPVSGTPSP
ncbi:hypothetical protein [Actinoplanes sp. NPDC051859]|uniref:hypothetical protein n=1 Tax=Actinoplanes sp. NPDC051859 TaxID=3363909 RepID=UPI0037903DB9